MACKALHLDGPIRSRDPAGWIDVSDKLPSQLTLVLIANWVPETGESEVTIGYLDGAFWYDEAGGWLPHVTHWRPLPKPPRKRRGESRRAIDVHGISQPQRCPGSPVDGQRIT